MISPFKGQKRRNGRRENHRFALLETLSYEPHLVIEPLHPILASQHAFRILIVHDFRVTNLTYQRPHRKVHQLVDLQRRIRLFALRADIALVV